ncbi:hypothetical protein G7045_00955 [Acidovorax sp. HDW3]|uniref:delta-class carbonic anhydrase n=1 Tax=Acidovorax sp. HDW3 TaxID=2714923 RepID=UPI00140BA1CA|nr:delta-class carbonic anhydrase [Acidovorax sp. HDW3]QIL42938.1 hypothetical protein G7045_00955 [Acidovorax sp. HDW3]
MQVHRFGQWLTASTALALAGCAATGTPPLAAGAGVPDAVLARQQQQLAAQTAGQGYGPQAPRDLAVAAGSNPITFAKAPAHTAMNLCNIHLHQNAEHKGGEFTQYAGNGDGAGFGTGYRYSGALTPAELAPLGAGVCPSAHGSLQSGDTIELHYVHSSAQVQPGPTLGACLNAGTQNPQLRVLAQVLVLVNDPGAHDFRHLTRHGMVQGYAQALGLLQNTGVPLEYLGSTTGPAYNEKGSPLQVTWRVYPQVAKVNIASLGAWCQGNVYQEEHAHGVRNLVTLPQLLAPMVP